MPSYLRINQVTSLHQSFPVLPLGCQSHLKKVAFRTLLQRFLINSLPGHLRICNNPRHFYEEVKSFLLSRSRAHLGFLLYYLYIYFSLSLFIYWIFSLLTRWIYENSNSEALGSKLQIIHDAIISQFPEETWARRKPN